MTLPLPQPQENRFHALEELVHESHMTIAAKKSKRSNKVKTIWARRLAACPPPPPQKKKIEAERKQVLHRKIWETSFFNQKTKEVQFYCGIFGDNMDIWNAQCKKFKLKNLTFG